MKLIKFYIKNRMSSSLISYSIKICLEGFKVHFRFKGRAVRIVLPQWGGQINPRLKGIVIP